MLYVWKLCQVYFDVLVFFYNILSLIKPADINLLTFQLMPSSCNSLSQRHCGNHVMQSIRGLSPGESVWCFHHSRCDWRARVTSFRRLCVSHWSHMLMTPNISCRILDTLCFREEMDWNLRLHRREQLKRKYQRTPLCV